MTARPDRAPLVAHIIHRLDVGGMENGLVNLVNTMPADRYRHAIVCMTDAAPRFRMRIRRPDVGVHSLDKQPGKDFGVHRRLWRLLRLLRPDIVHTRNLGTLEAQIPARFAGIRHRVHGEHGWDVGDPDGSHRGNRRLRRLVRPFVHQYIALSNHQASYLREAIGVDAARLVRIVNGVDTDRFAPAGQREPLPEWPLSEDAIVVGAVMRLQPIKAPDLLVEAFLRLRARDAEARRRVRLVLVGDGPMRETVRGRLEAAGAADAAWLPGSRSDIARLLRAMDVVAIPSHAEGICNSLLEAMASGLPVVATSVGGNPDLVLDGVTGELVPAGDAEALTEALAGYAGDAVRRRAHGAAARARAVESFSLQAMVNAYVAVYDGLLARR